MKDKWNCAIMVAVLLGLTSLLAISIYKELVYDTIIYFGVIIINIHTLLIILDKK